MAKSPTDLASELLESDPGGLREIRIYEFADDAEAHDDGLIERLYAEFSADLDCVRAELSQKYGPSARTGTEDDDLIPLNGVFRFAVWEVGGQHLFVAAAHEDRGVPVLLMLGTVGGDGE